MIKFVPHTYPSLILSNLKFNSQNILVDSHDHQIFGWKRASSHISILPKLFIFSMEESGYYRFAKVVMGELNSTISDHYNEQHLVLHHKQVQQIR